MVAEKENVSADEAFFETILGLSNKFPVKPYFSSVSPNASIHLSKNNRKIILNVGKDFSEIEGFVSYGGLMLTMQKVSDFCKRMQALGQALGNLEISNIEGNIARTFYRLKIGIKYRGSPSDYINRLLKYTKMIFDGLEKVEITIDEFRKFDATFEKINEIFSNVRQEKDKNRKGSLFERFISTLVSLDENIQIGGINVNTESEEIDVVLENLGRTPFYAQLQSPIILVECKNWTSKVGANEIREFAQKIQNRPRVLCKVGFMITTSEFTSDVFKELIGYRGKDFILAAADGKDLKSLIEKKIYFSDFLMDKIRLAGLR